LLLLLLEGLEEVAAEPAAATTIAAWRRARPAAEIEELRRSGACDADQDRNGDGERDQGAALGQHAEKRFWLSHPARSQWIPRQLL
jgi:hypothetical protein